MLQALETRLGDAAFILDGRRSVADAYLYVLLRWVEEAPGGLSGYSGLLRFRTRMEMDGTVQCALRGQGMLPVSPGT